MNLWCDIHKRIHHFSPGAVERVVYALQAAWADAESESAFTESPTLVCFEDVFSLSNSPEGYAEHVSALIERRRGRAS